jgi:predicted transcriptional regulator
MKQHETTDSVRINKDLFAKIKEIANSKKQSYSGYIELNLQKQVERDWKKLHPINDGL